VFTDSKFFIVQRVPQRSHYVSLVEGNGGRVVKLEAQADYLIADHMMHHPARSATSLSKKPSSKEKYQTTRPSLPIVANPQIPPPQPHPRSQRGLSSQTTTTNCCILWYTKQRSKAMLSKETRCIKFSLLTTLDTLCTHGATVTSKSLHSNRLLDGSRIPTPTYLHSIRPSPIYHLPPYLVLPLAQPSHQPQSLAYIHHSLKKTMKSYELGSQKRQTKEPL
jgi:hypothetical protein